MTTFQLHPGLAPVADTLDRVEPILPVETARARRQLADALAPITRSVWPEISHRLSLLTNTGIPVEFSWSSRHPALRWTIEVAGPETPKHERLAIASELVGADAEWIERAQGGHRLRYGAWLGGRHLGDRDDLKLYAELPPGASVQAPVQHAALDALDLEWRIGGVDTDGKIELYGRGAIDPPAIDRCERVAFDTTGELRAAVARLLGCGELPRPALFSVGLGRDGALDALTWFGFAERVFRDHAAAIAALAAHCDDAAGVRLLEALAGGTADARWRVGLVGVKLHADGSTSVQAAIRPS